MNRFYLLIIISCIFTPIWSQNKYDHYSDENKIEIWRDDFTDFTKWKGWSSDNKKVKFYTNNGLNIINYSNSNLRKGCYSNLSIGGLNKYEIEIKFNFIKSLKNSGFNFCMDLNNSDYGVFISKQSKNNRIKCKIGKKYNYSNIDISELKDTNNTLTIRNTLYALHFFINKKFLKTIPLDRNAPFLSRIYFGPYKKSICNINSLSISMIDEEVSLTKSELDEFRKRKIAFFPIRHSNNESVASEIRKRFTKRISSDKTFKLISTDKIYNQLNKHGVNFSKIDKYTAIKLAKLIGADAVIVGTLNDYSSNEEYLRKKSSSQHEGDEYRRKVSINLKLDLIPLGSDEALVSLHKQSSMSDVGVVNIKSTSSYSSSNNSDSNLASSLISVLADGLSYSSLSNHLDPIELIKMKSINITINSLYYDLISNGKLYTLKKWVDTRSEEEKKAKIENVIVQNRIKNEIIKKTDDETEKKPSVTKLISDVDINIPETTVMNNDAIAVVIGNSKYKNFQDVKFATNDSRSVKNYLIKSMGFRAENIIYKEDISKSDFDEVFGNKDFHKGVLFNMVKPKKSDVFIYYSGHGAPSLHNDKNYMIPVDCNSSYIELRGYGYETLHNNLAKLPAKSVTVMIDACFSGEKIFKDISAVTIRRKDPVFNIPDGVLMAASRNTEPACWYNDQEHGMFTYFFLKAIQNRTISDANNDGILTYQELFDYVSSQTDGVPYYSRRLHAKEQNPTLQGNTDRVIINYN